MSKDYYGILGVGKDSSAEEIKKAYRKKALKYHPDKQTDGSDQEKAAAGEKFKEATEAYEILSDAEKRKMYNQYGSEGLNQAGGGGFGGFGNSGFDGFSDIFEDIFGGSGMGGGGSRGGSSSARGSDMRYDIDISLIEAYHGLKAPVSYRANIGCEVCSGTGSKGSAAPSQCGSCRGSGRIRKSQGFFRIETTCPQCMGMGQVISDPCKSCGGNGRYEKYRKIQVNIPAGVDHGTRVRVSGEGEAGMHGGESGDLYVYVSIRDHEMFSREGEDLYCEVPVKVSVATLGGEIEIPCIGGEKLKVKIASGTQNNSSLRLRNKGMPHVRRGRRGDMYAKIFVEIPTKLTEKQKALLIEFDKEEKGHSCNPKVDSFIQKIRTLFGHNRRDR